MNNWTQTKKTLGNRYDHNENTMKQLGDDRGPYLIGLLFVSLISFIFGLVVGVLL